MLQATRFQQPALCPQCLSNMLFGSTVADGERNIEAAARGGTGADHPRS